jgi:hypothetical protein
VTKDQKNPLIGLIEGIMKQMGATEDPETGDLLGLDSTSDDPVQRTHFLSGRIHGSVSLPFGGLSKHYDIPTETLDEDTNTFTMRNKKTGLTYLVTVEEMTSVS